ncbi:MAG: adenylyl-sulfate reductase subunit alpha [Deltaproteobacteria bacterium]|nr:adenylyl-sulfate reductase subunit alpha [Deltaproteobacteria bacterium]MBW1964569.1 adenylyl-sulfate reductase subunit alpha [Deltaproteobacteria bacterium]
MALRNKPSWELLAEPDLSKVPVEELEYDALIVGGGMAATGTAFEIGKWMPAGSKVCLIDKAAMERSGAVAQGLSAINTYIGENDVADYVRMVRGDLMGVVREDLIYDLGRFVDDSVMHFEEWGLPIWKQKGDEGKSLRDGGQPVRTGKWQIMINGESYKCIVAEAAKNALEEMGYDLHERVFIVKLLLDANKPNTIAGCVGFSSRENKVIVYKCKVMMCACGGAVNIFRPRATDEGKGRAWYPIWNAGSTYTMCMQVGAEMTMMENRFTPSRFKDGYGPVGAWFLLFKAGVTNSLGESYAFSDAAKEELAKYAPYGLQPVTPTCLRNHLMLKELKEGRGPIYMDTAAALKKFMDDKKAGGMDEKALKKYWKELESEAWEDFLDMSCGQAGLWASMNIEPEKVGSEIMPTEPYMLGSHSGCCGIWVSGPNEDWVPDDYKWGYNRMTTVNGLFTSGDGVGASGHKFSSGSHAEGRMAAKAMAKYVIDNAGFAPALKEGAEDLKAEIYKSVVHYYAHNMETTDDMINPAYIRPRHMMERLMKYTDEYGGGWSPYYMTNKKLLEIAMHHLDMLREDSDKLATSGLHELIRAWEMTHRIWCVEDHLRHIQFREESRYPGFYYRGDFPEADSKSMEDGGWKCFVNSKYDPETGEWSTFKKTLHQIIPD